MYSVTEEASEADVMYTDNIQEAIEYAKSLSGKHLVLDKDGEVLFDSQPNISYKL